LMHKAFALSNLGRAEETIPLLKKVTELQPEDEAAWTNLASAYNETKMHSEAVSAAQQAIRLKPDLGRHWFHLAWARYALGDKTGAKKDYDELAKRDVPLAKEFLRRFPVDDRFQPAVASAQEPSRPARAVEGIASAKPQSPEEAQQRAALQPNDYTAWLALGDSYKAVKEYDQAIRAYRQAIALKADYGLAIYGLGEIYHLLGDKERVRDMYLALGNADKQLANQYFRAFILP